MPLNLHQTQPISIGCIRLVHIKPALDDNTRIECTTTVHRPGNWPDYVALSYTWGDANVRESVVVNEQLCTITRNCHDALLALRKGGILTVFIDALCIDQDDDDERSTQVLQMGDIFANAKQTIIFAGRYSSTKHDGRTQQWLDRWRDLEGMLQHRIDWVDFSKQALQLVEETKLFCPSGQLWPSYPRIPREENEVWGRWRDTSFLADHIRSEITTAEFPIHNSNYIIDLLRTLHCHCKEWTRVKALTDAGISSSPWFGRTWVVQEIMVSRKQSFLDCEGKLIDWEVLGEYFFHRFPFHVPTLIKMHATLLTLMPEYGLQGTVTSTQVFKTMPWVQLSTVLGATAEFCCQDPRDKLYAILALFEQPVPESLRPDYSRPHQEVSVDLSWYLLQHHDTLPLRFAGLSEHHRVPGTLRVPSWVIDWRFPLRKSTNGVFMAYLYWMDELNKDKMLMEQTEAVLEIWSEEIETMVYGHELNKFDLFENHLGNGRGRKYQSDRESRTSELNCRRDGNTLYARGIDCETVSKVADRGKAGGLLQSFETLKHGLQGLVANRHVQVGDHVVVLVGIEDPVLLRPSRNGSGWILIDQVRVRGLLYNEVFENVDMSRVKEMPAVLPLEDFAIV